jgi:SHS2 domain-containing protein
LPFEFIDHTADTAVAITAPDEAGLFQEAARALRALYVEERASDPEALAKDLQLEAADGESLLVGFLEELIYLFDAEGFLCREVEVRGVSLEAPAFLDARVTGERFDPARHTALTEVKAATYHGLRIERSAEGLRAVVVFDL